MPQSITGTNAKTIIAPFEDPYNLRLLYEEKVFLDSLKVDVKINKVQSSLNSCLYIEQKAEPIILYSMQLPDDGTVYKNIYGSSFVSLEQMAVYCLEN